MPYGNAAFTPIFTESTKRWPAGDGDADADE